MSALKDDWEKPRSRGQHLTATEINFIRASFRDRQKIEVTARTLQCSSRIVAKYYGYFRAEGIPQRAKILLPHIGEQETEK